MVQIHHLAIDRRICPSLPEIGVQKPQKWSCALFFLKKKNTWQFSNLHSEVGEGLNELYYMSDSVSTDLLLGPCASDSMFWIFSGEGGGPTGAMSKNSGVQGPGCGLGPLSPESSSNTVAGGLSVLLIPGNKGGGRQGGSQMKTQVSFLFSHPRLAFLDL